MPTHPTTQDLNAQIIQALSARMSIEQWQSSVDVRIGPSHFPGNMRSCNNAAATELRRLHVENEALRAKQSNKSFAQLYPPNPDATCKCEHWQYCAECHPTAPQQGAAEGVVIDVFDHNDDLFTTECIMAEDLGPDEELE